MTCCLLSAKPLSEQFSVKFEWIKQSSNNTVNFNMSSVKWWQFYLGLIAYLYLYLIQAVFVFVFDQIFAGVFVFVFETPEKNAFVFVFVFDKTYLTPALISVSDNLLIAFGDSRWWHCKWLEATVSGRYASHSWRHKATYDCRARHSAVYTYVSGQWGGALYTVDYRVDFERPVSLK